MKESSYFTPYMSTGLVCDGAAGGCAPTIHRQGLTSFITTPVDGGKALHLFDVNLHLKGVSQRLPSAWTKDTGGSVISHIAACHQLTFAAVGSSIIVFRRLVPFASWKEHTAPINILNIVGDLLVSISENGQLVAWSLPLTDRDLPSKTGDIVGQLFLPPKFKPSAVAHPQTYVNKILLGGYDGRCLLVNLRSKKIIHTFKGFQSRITVLEPSPVIDVVAVGTEDGRILLHNFRVDETILDFQHGEAGVTQADYDHSEDEKSAVVVKTLSFRSDGTESLMSGDGAGNLYIWDLNEKAIQSETHKVHHGGIVFARFLPGEPLLVTAGMTDNSIKIHLFDNPIGQPRILRKRVGHSLPPTIVRFCGYDGFMMVSAGLDRELRLVSTVHEARNREFKQGTTTRKTSKARKRRRTEAKSEIGEQLMETWKKLPHVTGIACGNLRQRDEDFANIVTIHNGSKEAYTWRIQNGAIHQHVLSPPDRPQQYRLAFRRASTDKDVKKADRKDRRRLAEVKATCVVVTPCGNYAIIGQNDGVIHSYNLQSGIHQGSFNASTGNRKSDVKEQEVNEWLEAHECNVVAMAVGSCGDLLASAGGSDKSIKFWNTHSRELNGFAISCPSNISMLRWCATSDLIAVSCEDFSIRIYDASTRKLARLFSGHVAPIVDITFDSEGRKLLSASIDCTVKTWYLPTGQVTDTLMCDQAPTSIAIAPSGDFLATTHVNDLSIKLWVDKSKYGNAQIQRTETDEDLSTENDSEDNDSSENITEEMETIAGVNEKQADVLLPENISDDLLTLSNKPSSQWSVLRNLREIKERNKPIEPPKKPENAPFFLPTLRGIHMEFDTSKAEEEVELESKVKASTTENDDDDIWGNSELGKLIKGKQNQKAISFLQSLDASGVDLQIRTMEGEKTRLMAARLFADMMKNPKGFELTQAYLTVFLSEHGSALASQKGGADVLEELLANQRNAWDEMRNTFDSVVSLSAHFSGQV